MNYEQCGDCRLKLTRREYDQLKNPRKKDQIASLDFEGALTMDCSQKSEGCAQIYVDWLNNFPTVIEKTKTFKVEELRQIELERKKIAKFWGL